MKRTETGIQRVPPVANLYQHFKTFEILSNSGIKLQSRFIDEGLMVCKEEFYIPSKISRLEKSLNLTLTNDESMVQSI